MRLPLGSVCYLTIVLAAFPSSALHLPSACGSDFSIHWQEDSAASVPFAKANVLPPSWHGTWGGKMTVHMLEGTTFDKRMELTIGSIEGTKSYTWRLVSIVEGKRTVREYELVPVPEKQGHFKIDEKNGIVLDAWLVGETLYTYYQDGEILITGRFAQRKADLFVELGSIETGNPRVTSPQGADFEVRSYRLGSLQSGQLRRQQP